MLLILVPLALIPASLLFWRCAGIAHGVMVSRSAALVMALIALAGAFLPLGRLYAASTAGGWRAWLASPLVWALAAIAWQACTWLVNAPEIVPGIPWMLDRAAALMAACTVWAACARTRVETPRVAWGLAMCGALALVMAALERYGSGAASLDTGHSHRLLSWLGRLCDWLGTDAPFGNQNFDISGALPLLGMSVWLWWRERQHAPPPLVSAVLALGWVCALAVASGLRDDGSGDPLPLGALGRWLAAHRIARREGVAGGMLELLAAMAVMATLWLLPRRLQLPACLAGLGVLLAGIFLATVGAIKPPDRIPSLVQRTWMWRSSVTAIAHAPIAGYGVGSAVDVLNHQDAYSEAYLTVPSFAEQAHDEVLETLLDGGLVNLVLVCGLLATTLWPLWRRRDEPVAAALLIAWTMLITHALVDVELSQAGPVLMLALLGGVSWYVAREGEALVPQRSLLGGGAPPGEPDDDGPRGSPVWRVLPLAGGGLLVAFTACELTGYLGNVPELQARFGHESYELSRRHDVKAMLAAEQRFIAQVGDLDENQFRLAEILLRQDPPDVSGAREACIKQSDVLPVLPGNLQLMDSLMRQSLAVGEEDVAVRLRVRLAECIERTRACLARVGDNGKNHLLRGRMARIVDHADQILAPAPPPPAPGGGAGPASAAAAP